MRLRALLVLGIAACQPPGDDAPSIDHARPPWGPLIGGTQIELVGTGFGDAGANRVLIGGREAPLVRALDETRLEVVIPPGERPGDAEVVVLNTHGNVAATSVFRYSTPPTITNVAPEKIVISAPTTTASLTGTGFLDEGAGTANVLVDGQLAADVTVRSDTLITFTAPPGVALSRPEIELVNQRGTASSRGFQWRPSARPGLLMFPPYSVFAYFFDPVDQTIVTIPRVAQPTNQFTAVIRDEGGEYWAMDRGLRFGRLDLSAQTIVAPLQLGRSLAAIVRHGGELYGVGRYNQQIVRIDRTTGQLTPFGDVIPCCGSYGLASDGTTIWLTARVSGVGITIRTFDPATGTLGAPVTLAGSSSLHVEDLQWFEGVLYATSRDSTFSTIDPTTGAVTVLPVGVGRANAMVVLE